MAPCGEMDLEEAMDQSLDRLRGYRIAHSPAQFLLQSKHSASAL